MKLQTPKTQKPSAKVATKKARAYPLAAKEIIPALRREDGRVNMHAVRALLTKHNVWKPELVHTSIVERYQLALPLVKSTPRTERKLATK